MRFMTAIPITFSDQLYLPWFLRARAPPLLNKARKEARARKESLEISKPPSTEVEEPNTLAALPPKTDLKPAPAAEVTPPEWCPPAPHRRYVVTPTSADSCKNQSTPDSTRISFKRLFGDTLWYRRWEYSSITRCIDPRTAHHIYNQHSSNIRECAGIRHGGQIITN